MCVCKQDKRFVIDFLSPPARVDQVTAYCIAPRGNQCGGRNIISNWNSQYGRAIGAGVGKHEAWQRKLPQVCSLSDHPEEIEFVDANTDKEHPLAGVVLCLTSVLPEQRVSAIELLLSLIAVRGYETTDTSLFQTELATIASQMGAIHKFDLTSDVTHLLVGETNTPKYKFVARERPDVKVLKPEWIQALRESWMQGGDTDLRTLEEQYRLPTFSGLSICITGFEDSELQLLGYCSSLATADNHTVALRNHLEDTATAHGAEFRKDLTKSVTHLVSRNTEGQKYKFATQWNIKVVTMKWFNDSIERGMVLEETLYHPLLPAEQQGAGAWNRSIPTVRENTSSAETGSNPRPRKLRRMASAKLEHQNENIWGDIVGTGFEGSDPKKSKTSQQSNGGSAPAKDRPVLQEAKSFASATTFADTTEAQPAPRKQAPEPAANSHKGFLHGCYFFIFGFSSKQVRIVAIMVHGGKIRLTPCRQMCCASI